METQNLHAHDTNTDAPQQVMVGAIGFNAADEESFKRFFQVTRTGQRNYKYASSDEIAKCPILLVNYDDAAALTEKDRLLSNHPKTQVVAYSRGAVDNPPPHHIRGLLFAARVLTTLDKIQLDCTPPDIKPVPSEISAPSVSNLFRQPAPAQQTSPPPIPALKPEDSANSTLAPTQPLIAEQPSSDSRQGYCALVVDDSIAIQKSIEINLGILPQITTIDFAESGEEAIAKAESRQYDLIFLDVMMPGIDGYETCTRLRKKAEYKRTPIIMVSGKTSPLDEVKGVMAGCTTYLTKPVEKEAFQKLSIRVLGWLEKQKAT